MGIYNISQFSVGLSRVKLLVLTRANVKPSLQIIKLLRIWLATRPDEETLCEILACPQAWKCEIYPATNKAVFDAVTQVVCLKTSGMGTCSGITPSFLTVLACFPGYKALSPLLL